MNDNNPPLARHSGLVLQEMPDELLIYDLNSDRAHCLNSSSALIWRNCDGEKTISEIVRLVGNGKRGVDENFVWLAIDQLAECGLMETAAAPRFAGESRRSMLKKIGMASAIAIPVVASIVAPKNAMAFGSCSCNTNADCATAKCPSRRCNATTNQCNIG